MPDTDRSFTQISDLRISPEGRLTGNVILIPVKMKAPGLGVLSDRYLGRSLRGCGLAARNICGMGRRHQAKAQGVACRGSRKGYGIFANAWSSQEEAS